MIGIAFTGSGKTLAFALPAILLALEQEVKMPFQRGEGPYSAVLCPSRELARQTFETMQEYTNILHKGGSPKLHTILCMGGVDTREQMRESNNIVHIAVCTPGRLIDMLTKKKFTFNVCRFFCMDEADRMIDLGFEEDVSGFVGRGVYCRGLLQRCHTTQFGGKEAGGVAHACCVCFVFVFVLPLLATNTIVR